MLAQRLPNCDIQTAIISTTIQRWANRNIHITIIEKNYNNYFKIANIIKKVNEAGVQTFCFGWRNVGSMPQICGNLLTLAQRWANGNNHTMMIEQNIEITNINQNMSI